MPSDVPSFGSWGVRPLISKDQMSSTLGPGWRCSEQGARTGHALRGQVQAWIGSLRGLQPPAALSPEDQKMPGSGGGMASPRGARALGPETQANCLENQPVIFKGGSGQGQHQIPAVPLSAHRHTAPKPRLNLYLLGRLPVSSHRHLIISIGQT